MDLRRQRRGIIFILSAPSGAGKTTISRAALERIEGLEPSVSVTTRVPREGEIDGVDYHFVSDAEFTRLLAADQFAESAVVFNARYGTLREPVERAIEQGRDILLDIDIQGARQLRPRYRADAVMIFVLPPSFAELEERLRRRGTEEEGEIARRLRRAHDEAIAYPEYDYLIINADIMQSLDQLRAIVEAERLKVARLTKDFVPWKP
ncbi:MAG TPA: guanylate kinase [Candidatus Binataceae bacterium]|jgi:guanylate kinase|nr:guanylate kinase [Candidatus Binataceae bacterium]